MSYNLAIVSPSTDAYSETFIRAHRDHLEGQISFYHGGFVPRKVEGVDALLVDQMGFLRKAQCKVTRHVKKLGYLHTESMAFSYSLKQRSIDVVLAEYGPTAVSILEVCRQFDMPMVVHFHGYDASASNCIRQFYEGYMQVFSYAKRIVVVSGQMQDDLIALGAPPEKIVLTACAPDDRFFSLENEYKDQQFLSVGRFVDKKAPYYTLLSFSRAAKSFPDARLVMVGEGPLLNTTKNLARALDIADRVSFPGAQKPEQIREYLCRSICLVQHSIVSDDGDKEGTPVAVLEAGAAGLPVVGTRHAGISDVIEHNVTGLLSDEHDTESMGQNLCRLLSEKGLASTLGSQARRHVYQNYRMEKHIEVLNQAIQESLST